MGADGGIIGEKGSNFCGSSYVSLLSLLKSCGVVEISSNPLSLLRDTIEDKKYSYRLGATSSYSLGLSYVTKYVD
jgi:hypothetical protein